MSSMYATAQKLLSERERDRVLCVFFNTDASGTIDWDKATQEFGAGSVESMRVSHRGIMRKLNNALASTAGNPTPGASVTPKKRKAKATDNDAAEDESAGKFKGKRGRKAKAIVAGPDADDDADDADAATNATVNEEEDV